MTKSTKIIHYPIFFLFKFVEIFIFVLYLRVFAWVYVCVPRACNASGGQKRVLVPLGLELLMPVIYPVGARN